MVNTDAIENEDPSGWAENMAKAPSYGICLCNEKLIDIYNLYRYKYYYKLEKISKYQVRRREE